MHKPGFDTTVGERSNFKTFPTITQDLSRRCIAMRGGVYLHTLEDCKAEAFINTVDVVIHLHDPSRPSTEHTAPPRSAHVRLDDILAIGERSISKNLPTITQDLSM